MAKKASLKARIAYNFDNLMSKGLASLVGVLALAALLFLLLVSSFVSLLGIYPPTGEWGFFEVFWASLLRTLDAGTMGNDQGQGFRLAMLVVTLGGVVLVASLIGIITNSFQAKVANLRKGRSSVLEEDHTYILGWNSKIYSVIEEIVEANKSRNKPAIVILADRDNVEMEDDLHSKIKNLRNTRLVTRSGNPVNLADVQIGNPSQARSIIILASDDVPDPDSLSIKTCLALVNEENRKGVKFHIVGEIRHKRNLEAANLVGGSEAQWVLGDELISRLIVQTARQSGLSAVFTELLDFEGDEIYIHPAETIAGRSYSDALLMFESGCLFGLIREGEVVLNPSPALQVLASDRLIVIAEDESKIKLAAPARFDEGAINPVVRPDHTPEKTLILGFNSSVPLILDELSEYMVAGSQVTVMSTCEMKRMPELPDLQVSLIAEDPTSRHELEKLNLADFDHVIVLADQVSNEVDHRDSRTLLTLLHLRELQKTIDKRINIVSEMLDDRNRELAEITNADDFIVSDKLVSLMLAQLEESPEMSKVFAALLSSSGSEIRLHPAEWYVSLDVPVDFNTVAAAASNHGDSAIGYRLTKAIRTDNRLFGIRLNPNRSEKVSYQSGDLIVVLTND